MDRISEKGTTEACPTLSTLGTAPAASGAQASHASLSSSSRTTEIKRSYPAQLRDRSDKNGSGQDEWWRTTIVYEVYVRSFCDSTGDGVGDLTGLRSKLDYFVDLGVETLWLSPIYPSPMLDFGYDISNFVDVDPVFGTLSDFKALISSMKAKGLRLVMDFVPNHTSNQHVWFQKSVKKELPYKDYYVWKPGKGFDKDGKPIPPNNWVGVFGGPMWEWSKERQEFYLHQFTAAQPDLNYNNPAVLEEMLGVFKFWLDLGVDGFRLDAVPHLFEDPKFRDQVPAKIKGGKGPKLTPAEYAYWDHKYTCDLSQTLQVLEKFRELCDSYSARDGRTRVMMSEGYVDVEAVMKYYSTRDRKRAHFPFNFELINLNEKSTGSDVFRVVAEWMDHLPLASSCPNWLIGNHDQPRAGTRMGVDLIDAMNMIVLLLPGVAITYYGEEIGMTNIEISWEETKDPSGLMAGKYKYKLYSRDPERTPMQWNEKSLAGFSSGKTSWLPLNPNYKTVNVKSQLEAEQSHLKVYKALVALRQWEAFVDGGLEMRLLNNGAVFAFSRRSTDANTPGLIVVVNFGNAPADVNLTCFPSLPNHLRFLIQSVPDPVAKLKNDLRNAAIEATKVHLLSKQGVVLAFSTDPSECCSGFAHSA